MARNREEGTGRRERGGGNGEGNGEEGFQPVWSSWYPNFLALATDCVKIKSATTKIMSTEPLWPKLVSSLSLTGQTSIRRSIAWMYDRQLYSRGNARIHTFYIEEEFHAVTVSKLDHLPKRWDRLESKLSSSWVMSSGVKRLQFAARLTARSRTTQRRRLLCNAQTWNRTWTETTYP